MRNPSPTPIRPLPVDPPAPACYRNQGMQREECPTAHALYLLGCESDLSCFCGGMVPCCSLVGGTMPLIRM